MNNEPDRAEPASPDPARHISPGRIPAPATDEDLVDDAVEGTFPASDPPGWEPLRAGPPRRDLPAGEP